MRMSPEERTTYWNNKAREALVGRTIVEAFYMDHDDADYMGWDQRPCVLVLDNGMQIIPQQDDEGNDGGSLIVASAESHITLPVLRGGR